jgi:dTDP-4-dehydrorhamnose 3,5-epimerase
MIFTETELPGAFIIEPSVFPDDRGWFATTWNYEEFAQRGLAARFVQANTSFNKRRGTLRGMHFQIEPYQETKLVRCNVGAIYDVIVDLREDSPTFRQWTGVELTSSNRRGLYVPEGFAHGFQTLEDNSEVAYQISEYYQPEASSGVRWNDPAFGITWRGEVTSISERDRTHPDFTMSSLPRPRPGDNEK